MPRLLKEVLRNFSNLEEIHIFHCRDDYEMGCNVLEHRVRNDTIALPLWNTVFYSSVNIKRVSAKIPLDSWFEKVPEGIDPSIAPLAAVKEATFNLSHGYTAITTYPGPSPRIERCVPQFFAHLTKLAFAHTVRAYIDAFSLFLKWLINPRYVRDNPGTLAPPPTVPRQNTILVDLKNVNFKRVTLDAETIITFIRNAPNLKTCGLVEVCLVKGPQQSDVHPYPRGTWQELLGKLAGLFKKQSAITSFLLSYVDQAPEYTFERPQTEKMKFGEDSTKQFSAEASHGEDVRDNDDRTIIEWLENMSSIVQEGRREID